MTGPTPPELPGYDFVADLGQGGFADVYLFRQRLPARQVAVKVLRRRTDSAADRESFENEANRMAALSTHPYIVTIYEVGVSPAGQPYLTMEYCPHEHFGKIARQEHLSVARVLEIGIKISGAVETAHQAGILHRDIKPANVLMTSYGQPALTDFGIAGGAAGDGLADSQGVSIPFASPEVLDGTTSGDVLSDVYSVGATIYALLAGRSPFSTGTALSDAELMSRVLSAPLPPTGRPDVPANLERVLANALQRNPSKRYPSAAAFGRALQAIEAELNLARTPLAVPETGSLTTARRPSGEDGHDDDETRLKAMQRVDPDGPSSPSVGPPTGEAVTGRGNRPRSNPTGFGGSAVSEQLDARTVQRAVPRPEVPTADRGDDDAAGDPSRRNRILASIGGLAVLLVVLVFIISQAGGGDDDDPTTTTTSTASDPLVTGPAPQAPDDVAIEVSEAGGQVVTWTPRGDADGASFRVRFTEGPATLRASAQDTAATQMSVETDERICVTVTAIRGGRVSPESTEVCTPS